MSDAPTLEQRAVELLVELSGPGGLHASLAATANYRAVFTRDAVMGGMAGILVQRAAVTDGLVATLRHLRDLQGAEGQVASNYELRAGQAPQVSFGSLAPRIDGATWYLLGVAAALRAGLVGRDEFRHSAQRTVRLLDALEYNGRHLVYVPTGGNWADEYIYEGYILYDQVLRAWALRELATLLDEPAWDAKATAIAARIDEAFAAPGDAAAYPLAAFTPARRFEMFDLAATALLGASGLLPVQASRALDWVEGAYLAPGRLPPAFAPVIDEHHPDWPALRRYHLHAFRNAPHEYHNGGIWPVWLGWLALACARTGRTAMLARLRELTWAALGGLEQFAFEEYLHGSTGHALGTPHMAYSATGVLMVRLADAPLARTLPGA